MSGSAPARNLTYIFVVNIGLLKRYSRYLCLSQGN
jgi:hypothetical protein